MFTGIIEELGTVDRLATQPAGARIRVRCREVLGDIREGASISVNGVCLTAVSYDASGFSADISPETLERSNLGDLRTGAVVNLERALSPSGRLGGHLVQGHIDGTGEFLALDALGSGNWWLTVRVPRDLERYVVEKGSIAIDGVSLTVASIEGGVIAATVIPLTYEQTALRTRRRGDRVNLECDILAKYVEKLVGGAGLRFAVECGEVAGNGVLAHPGGEKIRRHACLVGNAIIEQLARSVSGFFRGLQLFAEFAADLVGYFAGSFHIFGVEADGAYPGVATSAVALAD